MSHQQKAHSQYAVTQFMLVAPVQAVFLLLGDFANLDPTLSNEIVLSYVSLSLTSLAMLLVSAVMLAVTDTVQPTISYTQALGEVELVLNMIPATMRKGEIGVILFIERSSMIKGKLRTFAAGAEKTRLPYEP
jgi:hypothetical protein